MSPPISKTIEKCVGCKNVLPEGERMSCSLCQSKYDLLCANITTERFQLMDKDHKRTWMCPECHSKQPKAGNTNTPIRSATAIAELPIDLVASNDWDESYNITQRRKPYNKSIACSLPIEDNFFMECSNEKCMKRYDLKCLNIPSGAFKAYTYAYKKKWVCPDCICIKPKCGNMETPVIADTTELSFTATTPGHNVNIQRGSQGQFSSIMMDSDVNTALLKELRQFRSDIIARLDSQANAITELQYQFSQTKNDLNDLVKIITVIENKVTQNHQPQQVVSEEAATSSPSTFADAVTINARTSTTNTHSIKTASNQHTAMKQNINKRVTAKSPVPSARINVMSVPSEGELSEQVEEVTQAGWTTVRNKKSNRVSKDVGIGKNTELKSILAAERKKYLHVWRLNPETTVEAMTDHIKSICGQDVNAKIEKIKHKTERDYSSFRIGVSERVYNELNKAEVWPVNAEFNEWIWFRRFTKQSFYE